MSKILPFASAIASFSTGDQFLYSVKYKPASEPRSMWSVVAFDNFGGRFLTVKLGEKLLPVSVFGWFHNFINDSEENSAADLRGIRG